MLYQRSPACDGLTWSRRHESEAYLNMSKSIEFYQHNSSDSKCQHEISRVFLSSCKVHISSKESTAHLLEGISMTGYQGIDD